MQFKITAIVDSSRLSDAVTQLQDITDSVTVVPLSKKVLQPAPVETVGIPKKRGRPKGSKNRPIEERMKDGAKRPIALRRRQARATKAAQARSDKLLRESGMNATEAIQAYIVRNYAGSHRNMRFSVASRYAKALGFSETTANRALKLMIDGGIAVKTEDGDYKILSEAFSIQHLRENADRLPRTALNGS